MNPALELWFDFASVYSYLSIMRIEPLAQSHKVPVQWQPFLLGPIFKDCGWATSPFLLQPKKGAYMWRDIERLCSRSGIVWRRPSQFPRRALLPTRIALRAASEPWIGQFCRRIMHINFADDRDIDTPEAVTEALRDIVPEVSEIVQAAQSEDAKTALRLQTEAARARGIFGAPTFIIGREMFWGNDRLEDALRFASANDRQS